MVGEQHEETANFPTSSLLFFCFNFHLLSMRFLSIFRALVLSLYLPLIARGK
jgi:hypothetical protein